MSVRCRHCLGSFLHWNTSVRLPQIRLIMAVPKRTNPRLSISKETYVYSVLRSPYSVRSIPYGVLRTLYRIAIFITLHQRWAMGGACRRFISNQKARGPPSSFFCSRFSVRRFLKHRAHPQTHALAIGGQRRNKSSCIAEYGMGRSKKKRKRKLFVL